MGVARHLVVIVGFLAALVLAVSFLSTAQTAETGWLALWPACSARQAGSSCALCGMSHAFIAISHGRIDEAKRLNPHAMWLYAGFLALSLTGLCISAGAATRRVMGSGRR